MRVGMTVQKNKAKHMLKFFKSIRKKLIIQENTRKYLLYAVGEILLVVIGILIALQINNWNEQRKNRAYELTMLQEVKDAIETDYEYLLETIPYLEVVQKSIRELSVMKNDPSYSTDSLDYHLDIVRRYGFVLIINKSPFEAIKSGGLDRISNAEIRNNLSTFYGFTFEDAEEWTNQVLRGELYNKMEILDKLFDIEIIPSDGNTVTTQIPSQDPNILFKNPEFDQFLFSSGWPLPRTVMLLKTMQTQMDELIRQIENELKR